MDTKAARLVRTLRLRHLELLVVLSETTTMRDAATRLHLSQPAISKMLGEIERCFGARRFERSHQGILYLGSRTLSARISPEPCSFSRATRTVPRLTLEDSPLAARARTRHAPL